MKTKAVFEKIDIVLVGSIRWFTIAMFVALTLLETLSMLLRIVPVFSITWKEEVGEMLFAAMIFYGSAAVWILKGQFSAGDWIGKRIKGVRGKTAMRLLIEAISLVFVAVLFKYSLDLVKICQEMTAYLLLPRKILYSCMPIASGIMVIYSLKFIVLDIMTIVKQPTPEEAEAKSATAD